MAKDRARRRAEREAQRAAEIEAARLEREKAARKAARRARLTPSLPRRRKKASRYGALPGSVRFQLALGWLAVQMLAWLQTDDWGTRIAVAVVSLLALPLVIVLIFDKPSRRRTRR